MRQFILWVRIYYRIWKIERLTRQWLDIVTREPKK